MACLQERRGALLGIKNTGNRGFGVVALGEAEMTLARLQGDGRSLELRTAPELVEREDGAKAQV